MRTSLIIACAIAAFAAGAQAQDASNPCRQIKDDGKRLKCYDRLDRSSPNAQERSAQRGSGGDTGWIVTDEKSPLDDSPLVSAALASASLPLRAASITRFTAAISASEVAAVGAIAKGPAVGRASGLKKARVSGIVPRRPTLACANDESPPLLAGVRARDGRLCGSGAVDEPGFAGIVTAACLPAWIAGRGRGKGTFCASADTGSADSTQAAVNVR